MRFESQLDRWESFVGSRFLGVVRWKSFVGSRSLGVVRWESFVGRNWLLGRRSKRGSRLPNQLPKYSPTCGDDGDTEFVKGGLGARVEGLRLRSQH